MVKHVLLTQCYAKMYDRLAGAEHHAILLHLASDCRAMFWSRHNFDC